MHPNFWQEIMLVEGLFNSVTYDQLEPEEINGDMFDLQDYL